MLILSRSDLLFTKCGYGELKIVLLLSSGSASHRIISELTLYMHVCAQSFNNCLLITSLLLPENQKQC